MPKRTRVGCVRELQILAWLKEHDAELATMVVCNSRVRAALHKMNVSLGIIISMPSFSRIVNYARTRGDLKHWRRANRVNDNQLFLGFAQG